MLNYEGLILPPFMSDMEEYMRCLDVIAETNHIEALSLCQSDASLERDGETRILDSTLNAETFKKSLIIEDPDENITTEIIDVNKSQVTVAETTIEPSTTKFSTRPPSTDKLIPINDDNQP